MNIEFIDSGTVKITESLHFPGGRPESKTLLFVSEVVNEFVERHPSYEILSIAGPHKITNFHNKKMSKGEWTLKVDKKSKKQPSHPKKVISKTIKTKSGN